MERVVVTTTEELSLKSYRYWTASLIRGLNFPGWVTIRAIRRDVKQSKDLNANEREELYGTIVPNLEGMIQTVLGPIVTHQQWVSRQLYLIPHEVIQTSDELYAAYYAALHAASA
jgi:hypothetical protein